MKGILQNVIRVFGKHMITKHYHITWHNGWQCFAEVASTWQMRHPCFMEKAEFLNKCVHCLAGQCSLSHQCFCKRFVCTVAVRAAWTSAIFPRYALLWLLSFWKTQSTTGRKVFSQEKKSSEQYGACVLSTNMALVWVSSTSLMSERKF